MVLIVGSTLLDWNATNQPGPQDASAEIPSTASDLAEFLHVKLPKARIISTRADGQIDRSFILTTGDSDEWTLRKLPRLAERAREWQGTVLCECLVNWDTADLFMEQWREYGFARPPFVFFGDRQLLTQIEEALK